MTWRYYPNVYDVRRGILVAPNGKPFSAVKYLDPEEAKAEQLAKAALQDAREARGKG